MRRHLLLLPLLALAACGGQDPEQARVEGIARNIIGNEGYPGFRRPDGSFDRADYRRIMPRGCAAGMHEGNPSIPDAEADRFCACLVERILATSSDAELFAMNRDSALQDRKNEEAGRLCLPSRAGVPSGPGIDPEAPPPPEPVPPSPGQSSGTPPPVVQEPHAPPPPRR